MLEPDTEYTVSAGNENLTTAKQDAVTVQAGSTQVVRIVLTPRQHIVVMGRVEDGNGSPVPNAQVVFQVGHVYRAEGDSSRTVFYSANKDGLTTDHQGQFQFPFTEETATLYQFQLSANGYLPTTFPVMALQPEEAVQGAMPQGTFRLHKIPRSRVATIKCVVGEAGRSNNLSQRESTSNHEQRSSQSGMGQPVPTAKIVVVRPLTGASVYQTNEAGMVEAILDEGPQLIAVQANGFSSHYQMVDSNDAEIQISLTPSSSANDDINLAWFDRKRKDYESPARQILEELKKINLESSSFYRQYLYSLALASLDSQSFENWLRSSPVVTQDNTLAFVLQDLKSLGFQGSLEKLLEEKLLPRFRVWQLVKEAFHSSSQDEKDESYGEAILMASEMSGLEKILTLSQIAHYLVLDGRIESAQALVQQAHSEIESLESGSDSNVNLEYVARVLAAVYGTVNFDQAMEMITKHLDGYYAENERYKCLTLSSIANPEKVAEYCAEKQIEPRFSFRDQVNVLSAFGEIAPTTLDWLKAHIDEIYDSRERNWAAVNIARHQTDAAERLRWLEKGAESNWKVNMYTLGDDSWNTLPNQLNRFRSLTVKELDALLFRALTDLPAKFDSSNDLTSLTAAIRVLAMRDADAARRLLQPVIETDRWMLNLGSQSSFELMDAIYTAAWIDPNWGEEVVKTIASQQGPRTDDQELCNVQLYSGMICQLMKLAATRENEE
jgi:hypothetical protein